MSLVKVKEVSTQFGPNLIHDKVSFSIDKGEIYGILGGSGAGKSTIMREMILLEPIQSGTIEVLDQDVDNLTLKQVEELKTKWGVLFQFGALFSSLNVLENVTSPLKEYTNLPMDLIEEIGYSKLKMVGLPDKAAALKPSELSGGMKKE